jgi:hypothetical protein
MAAVCCPAAQAAVAERMSYQGNLRESGLLVTGNRSMTFRLYDAPAAGTLLWASAPTAVTVSTGVFRAVLTPSGLNWENALWLEVEVAGTVLSPREELTAAPFAANALYHSGKKYTSAAAAPASPGVGDLWFDTGTSALKFWSGSGWVSTAGSGAAHAATHAGAGGDPITGLGAYTLTGNITMSPGTSLAAGAGSLGVSVSTHLVVSGAINPASNLTVGGAGFSVAFASAVTAGWFYGNGAGLTGISAAPPANMATTDTTQTITGAKMFTAAQSLPTVSSSMTILGNAFSVGGSTLVAINGMVGIGTTIPASLLDVAGQASFGSLPTKSTFTAGGALQLAGLANCTQALETNASGQIICGTDATGGGISTGDDVGWTGKHTWQSSATFVNPAFSVGGSTFVVKDGNVGIGTTSPAGKLHVNGEIRSNSLVNVTGSGQLTYRMLSTDGGADQKYTEFLQVGSGDFAGRFVNDAYTLGDTFIAAKRNPGTYTVNSVNFPAGNVGIGTTAPNAKLTVGAAMSGTALGTTLISNAGDLGTTAGNELALANIGYATGNQISLGIRAYRTAAGTDWFTGAILLGMDVDNTVRAGGGYLSIHANGNVGIGTASPVSKLDVEGSAQFGLGATKSTFSATGALTMAGALTLPADPTTALQAATKQYVDSWTRPCVNPGDAGDIMVAVGDLCVDKYETSVWSTATGGTQYGINGAANYPCGNGATGTGQTCAAAGTKIYARSVAGVKPSTSITWFQANIACANAGKHLLTNAEWQAAAAGTADPGGLAQDAGPACNTLGTQSMTTGNGTSCLSSYGVENMIGSVWEWVADWGQYGMFYTGADPNNWADGSSNTSLWPDNAAYAGDGSWNVAGRSYNGSIWVSGLPAAVYRGGTWASGPQAGVFSFYADSGPSRAGPDLGFRCGRRR